MSSTANVQSYLQYVFRPVYTWNSNTGGFSTQLNLSNIDALTVNTARFGVIYVGDDSNNMYIGSNSGNLPPQVTLCNSSNNTSAGISSASGISNAVNSEFVGYQAGSAGKFITESVFIGAYAGTSNTSNVNNVLIGTANSSNLANVSNTISIGGQAGGAGNSNIYIGTSNGRGLRGSSNLLLGNAINLTTLGSSFLNRNNLFAVGSGANVLMAGDFSTGVVSIGSVNTTAPSLNPGSTATYPGIITLDVTNWTRVGTGLAIGIDPGDYTLDVNGNVRVNDGHSSISMDNNYNNPPYATGLETQSAVKIEALAGHSVALDVAGAIFTQTLVATSSLAVPTLSVTSNATVTGKVQSAGFFSIKGSVVIGYNSTASIPNVAVQTGLLSGLVYETVGPNYYNANVVVYSTSPTSVLHSSNIVLGQKGQVPITYLSYITFTLNDLDQNVVIANGDPNAARTVYYNFTFFPT